MPARKPRKRADRRTSDALDVLAGISGKSARMQAMITKARRNADIARQIFEARTAAGLTQRELARLVGTSHSAINRLEDADYEGHSVAMLNRIADALNYTIGFRMTPAGKPGPSKAHRSRSAA